MTQRAPAVLVDGVSKSFALPQERVHTLKERALHPLRRTRVERFDALREVSFAVEPGEFFGILGRNGSGKSTLLKCLAGIYAIDRGRIHVRGRLSPFIELGVGFNPDLAARDNVTINAIMLGLSPREARERFDSIIAFAGLEEFVDLKLKNYSSGMQVRLAFSVMIQVEADVLLIDEVLAVGDAAFQQKCFDVFGRMRDEGRTILFVTHDMAAVQRFCHRALVLENGAMRFLGEPKQAAERYVELSFGRDEGDAEPGYERLGDRSGELVDAWFEDAAGERQAVLRQGEPCTFRARVRFDRRVEDPAVAVLFEDAEHHPLFATSTEELPGRTGVFHAGEEACFSVSFENVFAPGRLYASPWVIHANTALIDRRPRMLRVTVTGTRSSGGLVDLPHDVGLERGAPVER